MNAVKNGEVRRKRWQRKSFGRLPVAAACRGRRGPAASGIVPLRLASGVSSSRTRTSPRQNDAYCTATGVTSEPTPRQARAEQYGVGQVNPSGAGLSSRAHTR